MGEIRSMLLMILMFSAVFLGMATFANNAINKAAMGYYDCDSSISGNYCPGLSTYDEYSGIDTINATHERINNITRRAEDIKNQVSGWGEQGIEIWGPYSFMLAGYNAIVMVFESFDIMINMVADAITIFGLPVWVTALIIGGLVIVFVFNLISAALNRDL